MTQYTNGQSFLEFPKDKKYQIIYADPPWKYSGRQYQDHGRDFVDLIEEQYKTMELDEIKSIPVINHIEKDSACFLWVVDSHLKEGIEVLESWGFKYVTIAFVWLKKYTSGSICYNFAPWTLKSTEICILGIRGNLTKYKKSNNVKQLVTSIRTKHSKKPNEVRKRIEMLFGDVQRIELFARTKAIGWDVWGNDEKLQLQPLEVFSS